MNDQPTHSSSIVGFSVAARPCKTIRFSVDAPAGRSRHTRRVQVKRSTPWKSGYSKCSPAQVGLPAMCHNPSIALTTPSGRFAPAPHTDRLFSCDQLLHVITVGSVAAEFLLVKQALDPASQAHLIRVVSLSHRPTHSAVPAAAQEEHRRSARAGGEQARPCPPRPSPLLLAHLGHVVAFWFTDSQASTDVPTGSVSLRELSARSAIWR